jgi:hypothetical protein
MVLVFLILGGVFGVGMVLVIYGTIVKNRWGINFDAISCPRCKASLPQIRKPRSLQEALWGGGACPVCSASIDKWGREVVSKVERNMPSAEQSEHPTRGTLQKKPLTLVASSFFCLSLLFSWLGLGPFDVPSRITEWMITIAVAAVETVIFTALFYFAWSTILDRFVNASSDESGEEKRP